MEDKLEDLIIRVIAEKKALTFEELRAELYRKGIYVDNLKLRMLLADLLRNNVIVKYPDSHRMKFLFAVSVDSKP